MEVGRRRRAADLESQQSHLEVNSPLNRQPVQCVQQRRMAWDRLGAWRTIRAALFCTR